MPIEIARSLVAELCSLAARSVPEECCGLLLGRGIRIGQIRPAANVAQDRRRHFEIDPQALIDAHRAARAGGPDLLGYFHSHPSGRAEPSPTDRQCASGDGRMWAIVGEDGVRFWRDEPEGFEPLSYRALDG
ncbi:Mov34/MPN/PAD-1 family protein [Altericroceibacterium xinjiangense]|uniref:Mov34/MPN/PAD-1 family protein n=1 Tax=Altericroceibacterium xinjiangense TaxID=762261 RepID=UPI000F7DCD0A|nr:M67 family metallopeptidase [Altericroceibacterium xinjiangense]